MIYASEENVERGFRPLTDDELDRCADLLVEAAVIIDAYNAAAPERVKQLVSCRMVRRQLGSGDGEAALYPMGASQGSASALGYSQSWTISGGTTGELYLSKLEKRMLGCGNRIGAHSPVEDL